MQAIVKQFRRGEQAYIPANLQTDVLNALFDDVFAQEPVESVGWVDEMLVVHEEKTGDEAAEAASAEKKSVNEMDQSVNEVDHVNEMDHVNEVDQNAETLNSDANEPTPIHPIPQPISPPAEAASSAIPQNDSTQQRSNDPSAHWLDSLLEPPTQPPTSSLLQEPSGDLSFGLHGLLAPFAHEETKEPLATSGLFSERFGLLGEEIDLFGRKESAEQIPFFGGEEKGGIIDMLQGSSRDSENAPSLLQIARDNKDREEKERMKKVAEEKEKRRLEAIARAEAKKNKPDLPESTIKKTGMGLKPRSIMLRVRKWPVCAKWTFRVVLANTPLGSTILFHAGYPYSDDKSTGLRLSFCIPRPPTI